MTLLRRVAAHLAGARVPHALIGAAALAARGIARSTFDIDLLTTDPRVLDATLWSPLRETGTRVDVRRGDLDDPLGGVVVIESGDDRPVDVVLGKHAWQTRAVERAEPMPDGPAVVLARDLILLKLYAGGTQDLWDVRELLRMPGAEQLRAAVDEDLQDLPKTMRHRWAVLER